MSNLTEGKKALSDGDFGLAEKKLLKALENRPSDSELWWSVMLCKYGARNDAELTKKLKAEYEEAAVSGSPAPDTPFDTPYCKNALKYAINTRRQAFINNLNTELADIWASAGRRPIHVPSARKPGAKRALDRGLLLFVITYAALIGVATGVFLLSYGIAVYKKSYIWTGFALFVAFSLAAMCARAFCRRAGREPKGAVAALMCLFAALCIALLVTGIKADSSAIITVAAVALAIVIMFMAITAYSDRRGGEKNKKTAAAKTAVRADYDRNKVISAAESNDKKDKKEKNDEYEDTFD